MATSGPITYLVMGDQSPRCYVTRVPAQHSQAGVGISVAEILPTGRWAGTAGSAAYRCPFHTGLIDGDLRDADAEFDSLLQRNCFDGSVVHVGDPVHDREVEARAGQCPRLCRPVKAIKNVWEVVRGNSRPVVADLDRPAGCRYADAA